MATKPIPQKVSELAAEKGFNSVSYYGKHNRVEIYSCGNVAADGSVPPTGLPTVIRYEKSFAEVLEGEDSFKEMELCSDADELKDKVIGCMVGGAVGDALGYSVEFQSYYSIIRRYGNPGITRYELDPNGKALISDDTQMSLFTANGVLFGDTRGRCRGIGGSPDTYCEYTYLDWLTTQTEDFDPKPKMQCSWLLDIPELYSRRAPGNTCISALHSIKERKEVENNSCGCGGVMRIAPIPLFWYCNSRKRVPYDDMAICAAEAARITHKHPMGYIPAAALALIISKCLSSNIKTQEDLFDAIGEVRVTVLNLYSNSNDAKKMGSILGRVCQLPFSDWSDQECIKRIGEGWTGHEALGIALYCALKHFDSFEDAVVAAVNHDGDSDSTGAICGNIMGALHGRKAIPDYYTENLELIDIIEEIAGDLYDGCPIGEYVPTEGFEQYRWEELYCEGHRKGDLAYYEKKFSELLKTRK